MFFVRLGSLRGIGMLLAMAVSLSACGGGGSHSAIPAAPNSPGANGQTAQSTFVIEVPKQTASNSKRSPKYVSSATLSIKLSISPAAPGFPVTANVTSTTGGCTNDSSNPGNYKCTLTAPTPIGNDTVTIGAYDANNAGGNLLSQQIQAITVVQGTANQFALTLDANAATMIVSGTAPCTSGGPIGPAYGSVGTSAATFTVAYTDPASKTIVGPGLPKLSVTTSGVTGGSLNVSVNQAAQTFTVTPGAVGVSGTVNVSATPANAGDGLSFNQTKSFTFSTGNAPPGSFLAVVEQTTATSGEIDLFTLALGGNTPGSDTFNAYTPAKLAVTQSSNETGLTPIPTDIEGPQALAFDTHGDLLIANGGGAGNEPPPDHGNLACVPAGAIATGANASTTIETNVDDPQSMAYDPRDGSVALANNPGGAPDNLAEFLLTGNYTAAPLPRDIVNHGFGDFAVINLPTFTAGTYATALTTGLANVNGGSSKIAVLSASGVETDISDATIDVPVGIGWDALNNQLVIANNSAFSPGCDVVFYNASPPAAFTKAFTLPNPGCNEQYFGVAVSPDGHVAVSQVGINAVFQVQVYGNTTSRNPVGGPIPFNGTSGGNYIFDTGNTTTGPTGTQKLDAMTWLSNTKLLIALTTQASGKQGLYIFDISNLTPQPAFGNDDVSGNPFAAFPTETTFHATTLTPFGVAYKP